MAKCKTIDEIRALEQINLQAVTAVKVSTDFSVFFFVSPENLRWTVKVFLWTPHLAGFGAALKRKKKRCLERLLKSRFFFFSFKKYIFLLTLSIPHCQQQICRNRSIRFLWNSQNFVCLHGGWQTATLRNNFDRSTLIDDLSVAFFQWTLRVVYSWSFIPYLLLSDSLRLTQNVFDGGVSGHISNTVPLEEY